jgi:deoxyribodipyrimidine photo-lyase
MRDLMPDQPIRPCLVWFRNDLRLADHAALRAAMRDGRPVVPVYVLDDAAAGAWAAGGASRWWLHHSLVALRADLAARGASLVLRRGNAVDVMPELARAVGATEVHTGGSALPWARRLDRAVADALAACGATLTRHRTMMLFNPDTLRTQSGGTYSVFTPFSRACMAHAPPRQPEAAPRHIPTVAPPGSDPESDRLEAWHLLPQHPDWAGGLRAAWTPGEAGAQLRLQRFLADLMDRYAERRDVPGEDATSRLSPHLAFGEISPAQVWHAALAAQHGGAPGAERFITELLWREFSHYLLWHHPDLPERPLRPAFARMAWCDDPADLAAWQRGRTGIPIVDAGMRQLWQTGWMHNRIRMVVASFLVKHLLLPWQAGEAWFWDTLVDADLASNSASWQWVAGSGADAAPYFRIFNPVLQGRKFDPEGDYVRRFVPELGRLDRRFVHAPWEAPAAALEAAGIVLGGNYPVPIVDLAAGRARALAAFAALGDTAA